MEQREFFKHVFRDGQGWACLTLPGPDGKPTDDHWFQYPAQLDQMEALAKENARQDVWFSPVLFSNVQRVKANGKVMSVAAADADTCDPSNFRLQPSLVVATSTGRYHVYWGLDQPHDATEQARLNRRISQVHKDQGCDVSFVNAAKLLRVPGTSNSKHPGEIVVVIADDAAIEYTHEQIDTVYPASEVPDMVDADEENMPSGLMEYVLANGRGLINTIPNSITMQELLYGNFHENRRSEARYKLLCELYEMNLPDQDVVAIAWHTKLNKYADDPRGISGLWAEAMKARADVRAGHGDQYDQPFTDIPEPRSVELPKRERSVFLTEEEQEQVKSKVNFIDQWVSWAQTKTDAPAEYHRAAAMTIMSAVYSEFGHAIPKFAPKGLKLNLWFMTLGRSTQDRKSTSRSYMNSMLRELKDDEQNFNYSLPEDVTPGGISLALNDRAHQASVFDRDEVQGLFKELLSQGYMAGSLEVFTKLYDGWSGGRLRASGDKKVMESVPVSFIIYFMGILTETTSVLTVTNFRSGFLTRFLYVIAERPEGFKPEPIEQASEKEEEEDENFKILVQHLVQRRNRWSLMVPDRAHTHPMRVDDDAWKRFQKYEADVNERANKSPHGDLIQTTAQRTIISTLKLACLIAMDDNSKRVKMMHMLQAISYAGEWYDSATTIAGMVSASEWERDVDSVEKFIIGRGGKTTSTMVHREFKSKKAKEVEDMINALEQRGVLSRHQDGPRLQLVLKDIDE